MAATPAAANRPGPALGSSSRESVRARVRQEDRPRDERKLQNNFGTGAGEAAEVWQRPRRRPTDRDQRSGRVSENPRLCWGYWCGVETLIRPSRATTLSPMSRPGRSRDCGRRTRRRSRRRDGMEDHQRPGHCFRL